MARGPQCAPAAAQCQQLFAFLMVSLAAGVPLACRTSPKYCKRDDPQEPTAKVPYPEAPIADLIERHEILPGAGTYDPSGH